MTNKQLPTVVLTGFDPFGGDIINPSWLAVQPLDGEIISSHRIVSAQLPTSFARAPRALRDAIRRHKPALVICVGQAGGRSQISLERIAINVIDARIADNDGAQPIDIPVVRSGPAAYFSTLPIKAMLAEMRDAGIPVEISQTAGTYVCNQVFYVLMQALSKSRAPTRARGGFIHIPYLSEQAGSSGKSNAGAASVALDTTIAGLRLAVTCALRTRTDLSIGAGATH